MCKGLIKAVVFCSEHLARGRMIEDKTVGLFTPSNSNGSNGFTIHIQPLEWDVLDLGNVSYTEEW